MLIYTLKAGGDAQLHTEGQGRRRCSAITDEARSCGTRSREIRSISDLDSSTHAIFFLNDKDSAMSIANVSHGECQWSVRSTFCSCPCVHAVIH